MNPPIVLYEDTQENLYLHRDGEPFVLAGEALTMESFERHAIAMSAGEAPATLTMRDWDDLPDLSKVATWTEGQIAYH